MYAGVAAHLVQPPINALRLSLHPDGLAPREHALRRQVELTADQQLIELLRELSEYAKPMAKRRDDRRVGEEAVGLRFESTLHWGCFRALRLPPFLGRRWM